MSNAEIIELHSNTDELFRLGEVVDAQPVSPDVFDIPVGEQPNAIYQLTVTDPYLAAMPEQERLEVAYLEYMVSEGSRERREAGLWQRKAGTAYIDADGHEEQKVVWGDPVAQEAFFGSLGSKALDLWRTKVIPSASALTYLSDPYYDAVVKDAKGETADIDDIARQWWIGSRDAIGMRSRSAVMASLLADYAVNLDEQTKTNLNWTSVACGTALPAMKAAIKAGIKPNLTLLDIDENAMKSTQILGEKIGFEGDILQSRTNIFRAQRMAKLSEQLTQENKRPRVVDAMGIFEYTGGEVNVDSAEFLRSIYNLVEPGGRLIFGQMRDDRPDPDFTMGVVGWPYVVMRSPKALMNVVAQAGINTNEVSLYLPSDGVYTVGMIAKPAEAVASTGSLAA